MPLTARPRFAPGDTITSAWANILDDDLSFLDVRTGGDPGGAGKSLESNGTLGAAWVGGKVARAGDTMTGPLTVPTGQGNGVNFGGSQIYEVGPSAGLLARCAGNIFYVFTGNLLAEILRATYGGDLLFMGNRVWHEGNDGPASGLAAQTAASATTATSATTAGSATTAASASDSAALGGVAASGYARIFSGTYAGNGAATLDVPLSFTPKLVFVQRPGSSLWTAMPSNAALQGNVGSGNGEVTITLTTNKFVVSSASGTNTNAVTYTYVALG